MKNIYYALIAVICITACEEKPVVIPEFEAVESGRVVLVEELTGVKCPNCPTGSARLESIMSLYPDNMITIGIHGIDLATPWPQSKYDFRNDDAAELEVYLKPWLGKPSAYFNRVFFEDLGGDWGNPFPGSWQSYMEDELAKPQQVNLSITREYDEASRELSITVGVLPLEDVEGTDFNISIMLTQNDVIDVQEDQSGLIEDYKHKHILMDAVTAFNGDFLSNELIKNQVYTKTYTYTLPDQDNEVWKAETMEIVAFVANTTGSSEEVIQAGSVHVME